MLNKNQLTNLSTVHGGVPYTNIQVRGRTTPTLSTIVGGLPVFYIGLGFDGHVNVNGTWKSFTNGYVNVNGVWKDLDEGYTNVNSSYKN